MTTRLPAVGSDYGNWGSLLDAFLGVAHNADGSLKSGNYLYLPTAWDAAWIAAKANIASQRISVVAIGDSITNGVGSTDITTDSYYAKLRSAILAANNNALAGDFYSVMYSSPFVSAYGGGPIASPPLAISGAFGSDYDASFGCYGLNLYTNNALSPLIVFTPPYNVVGFDIVYLDYASGTWNYKVDSGSTVNVTCTGPGTFAGSILKKVSITGLSSGSHTLTINAPSALVMFFEGITAYKATTGITFANMGIPSMGLCSGSLDTTNALLTTATFPPDRLALYQGYQGTTVSPSALSGYGFPAQPDLAIIAFGVNDSIVGIGRASFRDALDRLVWSLRYGKSDACSIMIVAMWCPDGTLAGSTTVTNQDYTNAVYTAYRDLNAAMLECAQVNNCAFIDIHGLLGRKPVTNGWITSASNLHPTPAGHLKIANILSAIV